MFEDKGFIDLFKWGLIFMGQQKDIGYDTIYKETNTEAENKKLAISFFNDQNNDYYVFEGFDSIKEHNVCSFLYHSRPEIMTVRDNYNVISRLIWCFTKLDGNPEKIMGSYFLFKKEEEINSPGGQEIIKLIADNYGKCPNGPVLRSCCALKSDGRWLASFCKTLFLSKRKYDWIKDFSEKQVEPILAKMK